jgi:hypothetical protein
MRWINELGFWQPLDVEIWEIKANGMHGIVDVCKESCTCCEQRSRCQGIRRVIQQRIHSLLPRT